MLFPGSVLALIVGAVRERFVRRSGRPVSAHHASLATTRLASLGE